MAASPIEVESRQDRRFSVLTDGTVRGDDGDDGRFAASLTYAARLATQVEFLLDVGTLEELTTVSELAITAVVTRDDAGGVGLSVRVDPGPFRQPKVLTVVGGADVHTAIAHCVQRIEQTPGVRWGAIVADDKRVVGASLPRVGVAAGEVFSALPNVGVRALAILGAIDEPLRDSWVQLSYERASLLVASLGPHCIYAVVDELAPDPFGEAIDEVRAILSPYDLSRAESLTTGSADAVSEHDVVPDLDQDVTPVVVASSPAPAGMRYRAPRAKQTTDRKRGFFGR